MSDRLAQLKADAKRQRWASMIRSEADERALLEGCRFDRKAGQHVVDFFAKFLCHSKGEWAGQAFELLPWEEKDVVMPLFGWMRKDGTRRYRRAGIWIAKKNGKSTLAAGLALYFLTMDGEACPEVYSAASDKKQAGIVHGEASRMVRASPALASRLIVTPSRKMIGYPEKDGTYEALSADVPTKEGWSPLALIFDELHAQKTRAMWDTLTYGGAARRQPMLVSISTAGFERQSIGYEQYDYAKKVASGDITDAAFFPYVREAELDDNWADPKIWRKANPSFGVIIREDEFREAYREAKNSPTKENTFRRYRLNQWTAQDVRWLSMDAWNACDGAVDADELAGKVCCAGLDLAKTTDLTALCLVFPDDDGNYSLLPFFFLPEDNILELEKKDGVPYRMWAKQGLLTLTPGNVTDYEFVKATIRKCADAYDLREVAYDPWNAETTAQQLQDEDGIVVVAHRQGYGSMSEPTNELERLVLAGKVRHGGHEILRWHASNATVTMDPAGNIKIVKADAKGQGKKKVDGVIAAIMGLSRAMAVETESGSLLTVL